MTHEEYDLFLLLAAETMEHRQQLAELERRLLDLEAARFADQIEQELWLAAESKYDCYDESLSVDLEAATALVTAAFDGLSHGEDVTGLLGDAMSMLNDALEALAM